MNDFKIIPQETRTLAVSTPNVQELIDKITVDIALAKAIEIDSDATLEEADRVAGRISTVVAALEDERKRTIAPVRELLQWLNDGYTAPQEYLAGLVREVKSRKLSYKKRLEAAQREREEAARREREEAARKAAEAEAEARRKAEAMLAEAKAAAANGGEYAAAVLVSQAAEIMDAARSSAGVALVAISPEPTDAGKVKGVRGKWTATVTDMAALVRYIGKRIEEGDTSLLSLLHVDKSALDALAKAQQRGFNLPGARADFHESVSVRKQPV